MDSTSCESFNRKVQDGQKIALKLEQTGTNGGYARARVEDLQ